MLIAKKYQKKIAMTCTEIISELKCKIPPCPCQKCAKLRSENGKGNVNVKAVTETVTETEHCDTPPERPLPKYRFQCKCLSEPEVPYKRKSPPAPPQHEQTVKSDEKCEEDDCNTGKGCCNTERNFLSFMINIIGFIA